MKDHCPASKSGVCIQIVEGFGPCPGRDECHEEPDAFPGSDSQPCPGPCHYDHREDGRIGAEDE